MYNRRAGLSISEMKDYCLLEDSTLLLLVPIISKLTNCDQYCYWSDN